MSRVPVPASLTATISQRAVTYAKEDVRGRGWKSSNALQPAGIEGGVGISSSVSYLLIQNRGFDPFLMWWVNDRTLPLGCARGDGPHFRKGGNVGKPGMVDIPHVGKVFRQQRWRHPGLKPKHFLESAISRSIKESQIDIQKLCMDVLTGGAM